MRTGHAPGAFALRYQSDREPRVFFSLPVQVE